MRHLADEAEKVVTAKLNEDFARAVTDPSLAAAWACFGRTTVTRLSALPGHSAYNKARGFNIDDVDHLPAVCTFFAEAGLPPLIEVWAGDASATLGRTLAHAGFYAAEVNVTLQAQPGRSRPATVADQNGVEIREVAPGDDDTLYLDTLFQGYGLHTGSPSAKQTIMTIEHRSPYLRRYLAYIDGRCAAAAALYTMPRGTYFAGAATIPAMRNRGCQSALIQRRLHDAAAATHPIVVTAAFGSPSHANLQRFGFQIVHTRTVWRRFAATE